MIVLLLFTLIVWNYMQFLFLWNIVYTFKLEIKKQKTEKKNIHTWFHVFKQYKSRRWWLGLCLWHFYTVGRLIHISAKRERPWNHTTRTLNTSEVISKLPWNVRKYIHLKKIYNIKHTSKINIFWHCLLLC